MQGHKVWFTTAANMLNDLAALDGDNALLRRINHYARPAFLIIMMSVIYRTATAMLI